MLLSLWVGRVDVGEGCERRTVCECGERSVGAERRERRREESGRSAPGSCNQPFFEPYAGQGFLRLA